MANYKVKQELINKQDNAFTLNEKGELIALIKEGVKVLDGGKDGPEKTVKVPLATQADLKYLFDSGSTFIEKEEIPTPKQVTAEKQ